MNYMNILSSHEFRQWGAQFLAVLFLSGGLALLAIGLGLIFNSPATLRFFTVMNRWISLRRVLQPAEVPRDTRQAAQKYRLWLAVIFIAGGVYAIYGLTTHFNAAAVIFVFGLDVFRPSFASWLVESARWLLIVGNLVAIIVGIMLGFFSDALIALEARGGRWYSQRQLVKAADTMHLTLDKWVAAYPRAAGWIITFFAVFLTGAFGFMLAGIR